MDAGLLYTPPARPTLPRKGIASEGLSQVILTDRASLIFPSDLSPTNGVRYIRPYPRQFKRLVTEETSCQKTKFRRNILSGHLTIPKTKTTNVDLILVTL